MKVAAVQINAGNNKEENIRKAVSFVGRAISKKADLICLPEVFNFRGVFKSEKARLDIAERIPGASIKPFAEIAKRRRVFILCGSIYEKVPGQKKVYNTSVLINPSGKVAAKYRKIHLFDAVIGRKKISESANFLSGHKKILTDIRGFKTGLSVCYDLRFPDLYQAYGRNGADLLCVPSAFTKKTGEAHWETLLKARAIENLCYVIAPDQIGQDGRGVAAYGRSMIVDPWGKVLAKASPNKEEIIFADVDKKVLKAAQKLLPGIRGKK